MLSTARPRAWSALADAMQRLGKKKSTPAYRARLRLQPRERCFLARGRRHASRPAAAWSARRGRAGTALDAAPPSNRQHGARGTEASARRQDRCASAAQPQTQPVGAQTCEDHVRRKLDGLQRHAKQRLGRRDPDDEKVPAATCGVWSAPACAKAWRDLSTWRGFQHGSRPPPPLPRPSEPLTFDLHDGYDTRGERALAAHHHRNLLVRRLARLCVSGTTRSAHRTDVSARFTASRIRGGGTHAPGSGQRRAQSASQTARPCSWC